MIEVCVFYSSNNLKEIYEVEELKKITKDDLIEFFENFILNERRRLIIQVFASRHEIKKLENKFYIEDVNAFKHERPLYPSFIKY